MEQFNPYEAPKVDQTYAEVTSRLTPAYSDRRFFNSLVDNLAMFGLSFVFGLVGFAVAGEAFIEKIDSIPDLVYGMIIALVYYVPLETATGRTLGKLITGTIVVNSEGTTPSLKQVIGRTFCRFVPFDVFSFLGKYPRGWHDRWSGTYVIRNNQYCQNDQQAVH